jgi:hypothetical protein
MESGNVLIGREPEDTSCRKAGFVSGMNDRYRFGIPPEDHPSSGLFSVETGTKKDWTSAD